MPLLLFGYYNPIFVRGEQRTVLDAHAAGVDGLLVVDLPVEEAVSLRVCCKHHGMSLVPLLTPTSAGDRVARTKAALAECDPGFVYYVSMTGVTGSRDARASEAGTRAEQLRAELASKDLTPSVLAGFGIDSPEKARAAAAHADGVIVGSAIVRLIANGKDAHARREAVTDLIRSLRTAIDH